MAAIGVCALLAAFAIAMLRREPRLSGTDLTPNGAFIAAISAGQQACQGQELLPADTAAIELTIGTYGKPGPPLEVTVFSDAGHELTHGGLAAGWRQGVVRIPVQRVRSASPETRVCLRELGSTHVSDPIALAGDEPDPGLSTEIAGQKRENARLRVDYLRPGRESWYQLLPTIAYRSSLAKAGFLRHWEWAAVLVLILGFASAAVWTALRYVAPSKQPR